jgi:hypothetical protein
MNATEINLTRKLRLLIDLQEIDLTVAEAELYGIDSMDILEDDFFNEKGETSYE